MRISLNWLQELVDITRSADELAHTLTMAGFEVEDIEDRRTWADGVVIGEIVEAAPHPNANKLQVCQVNVGAEEPLNIVCGASNARQGIRVPVAVVGTYLSKIDLKIKPAKLRGVKSYGMICSLSELGLEKESEGIHIFTQEDLTLGSDVRPLLGLDDVILDLTSTANRADALSLVGIAREVAALTGATLKLPNLEPFSPPGQNGKVVVKLDEQNSQGRGSDRYPCPVYIGTVIEGLQLMPSPAWLQQRLVASGVRPINNVVDITNYVLLEWGQPLHAFDYDRLLTVTDTQSPTIGVRFAQAGETLVTLDGQSRDLCAAKSGQSDTLVITANDQPVALAGVMGGEATEVHDETTRILLEAALFTPIVTRRSARSQGLRTEASARYERGVNPAELDVAAARAIQLLQELASGEVVAGEIADFRGERQTGGRQISLRFDRVKQVLGSPLANPGETKEEPQEGELLPEDVERILSALGCTLEQQDSGRSLSGVEGSTPTWIVTIPPYRYRDLEREIDLIEEIARLYGYDNFCETLPAQSEPGYLPADESIVRQLREALRGVGLTEVMHYSYGLSHLRQDSLLSADSTQVAIANPLFTEYSTLRTELLSSLILAFQYNLEQGNGPLNGFEIGRIFWNEEDGLMEADSVAGIISASSMGNWIRGGKPATLSWYEAKGLLEAVFERVGLSTPGGILPSSGITPTQVEYQPNQQDKRFHPGRTASLWLQGERLGTFGQLHPQLCQELEIPDEVYAFELDLEVILATLEQDEKLQPIYKGYSTYPGSDRDLAFFADRQISVAEIEKAMVKAAAKGQPKGSSLLESVELFDRYQGENVPEGQRSLAFRLVYRAGDRTLADTDVEPIHQQVRDALVEKFSVTLRS